MKKLISTIILISAVTSIAQTEPLSTEKINETSVWVSPNIKLNSDDKLVQISVWFDQQFLGDGKAYTRRAQEFSNIGRRELRTKVIATLKRLNKRSYKAVQSDLTKLEKQGAIKNLRPSWIVNGFSCQATPQAINALTKIKGVSKIFGPFRHPKPTKLPQKATALTDFDRPTTVNTENLPWYISKLKADQVWKDFNITGEGTLNIIHDFNFVMSPGLARTVYNNPKEIPNNGKDDDGNGLIDDIHGFNFQTNSALLNVKKLTGNSKVDRKALHGTSCANIVCGTTTESGTPQFGIAPMSRWAGVISNSNIEASVEWAIEQGADTYSMSFSRPGMGENRSHWRKIMEHGSFCGLFFVSGAGNFAQTTKVPVQMRIPEDIPEAVFAAAGVKQDLSRTPFSSKGPVEWKTQHYQDGLVQKPEVCAFNYEIPMLTPNGEVAQVTLNGNSFAGPMFCGTISLMLSADPDLLPWDLKKIITSTATDIAAPGVDYETGHGLINCHAAVKEVLRQKNLKMRK